MFNAAPTEKKWTAAEAVALCRVMEGVAPKFGAHIALTGGCLYKDGERKDADIMIYRIRQVAEIDVAGLFSAFERIGVNVKSGFGFVFKAEFEGKAIDLFFPEEQEGEYDPEHEID